MNIPVEKIIEELSRPEAWPDPVDSVEVRQTHISVIFLSHDRVLKVKKPVDFGFLDFTTLEKRHHFCEVEVDLNRRLSPEAYLGVLPVTHGADGLRFGGPGDPVEYAVFMKRLDEEKLLWALLERRAVGPPDMERIARKIASFHREASKSPEITRIGGTEAVIFNTEENFDQIEPYVGETLDRGTFERVRDYTRGFIRANEDLFRKREAEGWIRDGHGDLHTQHICLDDEIQIFDCIEFNERFRFGDILSDAAFLVMDLDRLGFGDLAQVFRSAYLGLMGQEKQSALLNFYSCYRAVVRGKVEGFRSRDTAIPAAEAQEAARSARSFHHLAGRYAGTLHPPALIVACGLMGSGKSTAALRLRELLDIEILSSDRVRKELADIKPTTSIHVPFGEDIYSREFTLRTYGELHQRARALLEEGRSVFLDASYMDPSRRSEAMDVAREKGVRAILIYFEADKGALEARLEERIGQKSEISDGRGAILSHQMEIFRPPDELPAAQRLTVDTSRSAEETLKSIYSRLLSTS